MDKMQDNAKYIFKWLGNKGWSKNAVCGILGNMQTESTINPGRWESDRVEGNPSGHGYGLCQWTPYTKYTTWIKSKEDAPTMDGNLSRIMFELENGIQWIKTQSYPMSFYEFSISTQTPRYLAMAFLKNYERPADPNQPIRGDQAEFWWDYLSTDVPIPIPVPEVRVQNTLKWLCSRGFRINIKRR